MTMTIKNFSAADLAEEYLRTTFRRDRSVDVIRELYEFSKDRDAVTAAARSASGIEAIDNPTDEDEAFVDDMEAAIVEAINPHGDDLAHAYAAEIKRRARRITATTTPDECVDTAFDAMTQSTSLDSWGADIARAVADSADVIAEDANH